MLWWLIKSLQEFNMTVTRRSRQLLITLAVLKEYITYKRENVKYGSSLKYILIHNQLKEFSLTMIADSATCAYAKGQCLIGILKFVKTLVASATN